MTGDSDSARAYDGKPGCRLSHSQRPRRDPGSGGTRFRERPKKDTIQSYRTVRIRALLKPCGYLTRWLCATGRTLDLIFCSPTLCAATDPPLSLDRRLARSARLVSLDSVLVSPSTDSDDRIRLHKYVIIGPQAAGKSTQCRMLGARFDFVHISVGDIFRWHLESRTKLASRLRLILDSGNLIPDEIVMDVVRHRLEEHDWNYGFVLDGFPRTRAQADFLWQNWDIDNVIYLDVPDDVVINRVRERGQAGWGSGYTKRAETNRDALRRRIRTYHYRTKPLLDLYDQLGILTHIEGNLSISAVFSRVTRSLNLLEGTV